MVVALFLALTITTVSACAADKQNSAPKKERTTAFFIVISLRTLGAADASETRAAVFIRGAFTLVHHPADAASGMSQVPQTALRVYRYSLLLVSFYATSGRALA